MSGPETDLKTAVLMFNWVEYSVFWAMLVLSMLIGVYYGWFKKQDTVAEYMLGGKKMGVFPVTMSMVASHISGGVLLGVPAEIYRYGTQYCAFVVGCNVVFLFVIFRFYLPVFYHLQLNSLYEYLELRFSKGARTLGSLIFAISLVIFIPVIVYVPALAFNQVTGVSIYVISPIVTLICIFYTSVGGLRAVVWTDTLQSFFTLGSTIFVVVLGIVKIGSLAEVLRINDEGGRLEFFNMSPSPFERTTFWSMSIGNLFIWISQIAVHPGAVQRFISVPTFRKAQLVMLWSSVGFLVIKFFVVIVGLLLFATYHDCDPIATKMVKKSGQMVPFYVMRIAKDYPGITGLFISGVLSAALSTMSAGLNTVAGTLYEDFVLFVLKGKKQSETKQNITLKFMVLVLGLLCTSMVVFVEKLGDIFHMVVSLMGVTNGALAGIFSLGIFFPRANAKGAMAGALTSLIGMAVIVFGAQYNILHGHLKFPGKATSVAGCPANFTASLGFKTVPMAHTEADLLKSAALMFNWVEYSVFCTMLILSMLIGVYFGWFKKQDTVAEYMLGGKKMGIFPVTMSLVFSHVSGLTLLGIPSEVYSYGTQYAATSVCNVIMLVLVNYFYLPVFFDLQLNSLYQYLELRFDKKTRTLSSFIFALSLLVYIPVVVYIPALAFNQVTGVSVHIISPIVSLICVFYTSFGGLKAVVWTDALQSIFTFSSTVFIFTIGVMKLGGVGELFRINGEGHRLEFFNMDPNPFSRSTFWTVSIGSTFYWLSHIAVHPGAVQRFIAVSTLREAKLVMIWSCIGFFIVKGLSMFVGMLLYASYHDCDPVATGMVKKVGQLLPHYVMIVAKDFPGITGLFISGVLSAALSTMSACLNTVAGTMYEDFVHFVLKGKKQSEAKQSFTIKLIVLVLGILCTLLVMVVEKLGAIYQMALSLMGVTNGALVGVFSLGLFFPRANAKGAVSGAISSLVGMILLTLGSQYHMLMGHLKFPGKITSIDGCPANLTANLGFNASERVQTYIGVGSPVVADDSVFFMFKLSYLHYVTLGTLIAMVVGLVVSYMTEPMDPKYLDPKLYSPVVRRFLPKSPQFTAKHPAEEYKLVSTDPDPEDFKKTISKNINFGA